MIKLYLKKAALTENLDSQASLNYWSQVIIWSHEVIVIYNLQLKA